MSLMEQGFVPHLRPPGEDDARPDSGDYDQTGPGSGIPAGGTTRRLSPGSHRRRTRACACAGCLSTSAAVARRPIGRTARLEDQGSL